MYVIKIYNPKKTKQLVRLDRFISLEVSKNLNKENLANFSVLNIDYYKDKLWKKNIVEIIRKWKTIFEWLIIWVKPSSKWLSIDCEWYSHILKHRYCWGLYEGTNMDIFQEILEKSKEDWDINIDFNYSMSGDVNFDYDETKTFWDSVKDFIKLWKELYIENWQFYLYDKIWDDKTNYKFKFLETRIIENNINNYSYTEEWSSIFNHITGITEWIESQIVFDQDSIEKYEKYPKKIKFDEANDEETLLGFTQQYLNENKEQIKTLDFSVNPNKIEDIEYFTLWDLVSVVVKDKYIELDSQFRIIWKKYIINWGSSFSENITLTTSQWKKDVLWFIESLADMKNRLLKLENKT